MFWNLCGLFGSERAVISDAEVLEDVAEDFVGGDFAGDGAEVVEGLAEVLGDEVGRGVGCDAGAGEGEGAGGGAKGVVMPSVSDEIGGPGARDSGLLALGKGGFEQIYVVAGLCGDSNYIYFIISEGNSFVKFGNNFVNHDFGHI